MPALAPSERRALRARAHALKPVVLVGHQGLTPAVLHEIDVALTAHELVKVRAPVDERDEREALLQRICAELGCAPVQHLGRILTVWRPAPPEEKLPEGGNPRRSHAAPRPARTDAWSARCAAGADLVARPNAVNRSGPPALVFPRAAGRLHLGRVALALADQRAGDRRVDRDLAVLDVGLVVADDLVGHAIA
jgi:putative YhbY family RNA-binding protein